MREYLRLLMGLVSGFALIMLNNDMVLGAIGSVTRFFDPTKIDTIFFKIGVWISRGCIILSFVGVFIVIIFAVLILKRVIFNNEI
ncbi:hypothetical protein [Clostridium sp.]|uniref:hypothetical protein n=1 Tax=Clostridium sp. TaxID=1506 RepID=UPI002633B23F|nr:hypothetical protein [Clostridium sp.]